MLLFSFVAVFLVESGEETEVFPRPCTPLALTPAVPKPTPNHWGLKMAWLGLRVSNFRQRMPDWTVSTCVLDMLEATAGWGVRGLLTSGCSRLDSGRTDATCWVDKQTFSVSQGTVWIVSGAKSGQKFRFPPVITFLKSWQGKLKHVHR